jgi:hypothetical protein
VLGARFLDVGKRSDGMAVGGFIGKQERKDWTES